ncbi:MAG: peptidoglycan-binding domain-containing protein [Candidatus Paceibacterota bacterium]|jgi:hypothetical protein
MTTVTTKAMAKVAAVATGLAMATSMLSLAPIAHAADYVFTRDLTIGSRGADVTALQNGLIAAGQSIPAGATGYFGAQTRTAVSGWQKAMGISPTAGYFGAKSRAAFTGGTASTGTTGTQAGCTAGSAYSSTTGLPCSGVTTTGAGTGTGLKVALAASSPSGSVLVQGQAIGVLGEYIFSNPTSAPINVTALSFKRTGVSNDSTLTNVYLYNNGTRITDSAGVSNSAFSYSAPTGIFTVPAGGTYSVAVRSDILSTANGQQIGVGLVSVTSTGTLDSSVSFPVNSGYQTVSAATLAGVDYVSGTSNGSVMPSATSISPQNDFPVWQVNVAVSTNPVKLSSIKFTNLGSIDSAYVTNLRLYVDGVMVGSAMPSMSADRTVTFDLTTNPTVLSTQSHVVKVLANITGGSNRTIQFSVQRSSDAMFVDSQLGQPVTPTNANATFSAVSAGIITMNYVSSTSGVSVSLAPSSPTAAVAVGASSVKWGSFNMLASGENVKVSDLYVFASTTASSGALDGVGGLKNGKIMLNGVQVGSTKDIGSLTAAATDFSLGSSLILPAGQTVVVDVYGDAKTTASANLANNTAVVVTLKAGSSNGQGMSSLNSVNVPASAVSSNSMTVTTSTLTATKYTGYGNQTMIAGATGAKLGSFTLAAGSTEGVTVNTINFSLSTANAASITNLLIKDEATGTQLGSVISTPSTSNSYAVNLSIPVSGSKIIGIYGDILSSANAGPIQATITTSTSGTGDMTGTAAAAASTALQTITLGSGTLTATRGAGDPVSNNVLAGASSVMVGQFNFAAANSAYTIQNLAILVPFDVATSVTNVTLKYKDVNGTQQSVTQPLTVSNVTAGSYATATFTGLTMYVPLNDSANLDVYVGTPTIASGATSGYGINVRLDEGNSSTSIDNTFRAVNSAGTAVTTVSSGNTLASNGTFYVRKSIPTFAMLSTGVTVPSTGTPIYKFSVTADPAGAIEWSKLVFNIATSSTAASSVTNVYLTDDASGVNLLDNTTTSASTTATTITVDLTKNATASTYAQVAAGATKTYDLYGTVAGFTTGSTVTISLAADTSHVANGAASASGNTSWSDRSAASHTTSTLDWTNGYLIKNFTSNATTYSK